MLTHISPVKTDAESCNPMEVTEFDGKVAQATELPSRDHL